MIVGGFREEEAWKNFPVSSVGGQALKQAREYLNEHQRFFMPGNFRYWVIPKFVFGGDHSTLREMLYDLEALSKRSPGFGLGNEAAREYSNMEEDLRLLSKDASNRVLMTFLFNEQQKGQLLIKLSIDDVPPSRLRQLVLSQKQVAKLKTYSDWIQKTFPSPKDEKSTFGLPIRFSFGLVWQFYQREAQKAGEAKYDADYLQFIRQLYLAMPPDPRRILRVIMETLEALFKNPELGLPIFDYRALQGLCWVRYLCELNLWQPNTSKKGVEMKLEMLSIEPDFKKRNEKGEFADPWMASLETFLQEHPEMARSSFLFGTFLLGCLVRLLLDIQSRNLPGTPFEKELKGLRLKREDIPLLFSKTIAKLRDYDSDNFPNIRVLDQLVSDLCLRERAEDAKLTHEEVSAYFAFGLAQGRVFKALVKPKKSDSSNSNKNE
jgi:CRISPR-associated protein Csh1